MTQAAEPKTLGEINDLLKELRFTSIDRLKAEAISKACKQDFINNLMALKKAQGRDPVSKSWLSVALSSMSDFVGKTLADNGIDIALEDRLKKAIKKPENYLQSVKKAKDGDLKELLNLMNGHQDYSNKPALESEQTTNQVRESMNKEPTLTGFIDTPDAAMTENLDIPDFDQVAAQMRQEQAKTTQSVVPTSNKPVQQIAQRQEPQKQQVQQPVPQAKQGKSMEQTDNTEREYHSIHFYGGKNAVCLSVDETRSNQATVRLEGAPAKGQRMYDWTAKIAVQLTIKEMIALLAVFLRRTPEIDFNGHGADNEKGFSAKIQGDGYYIAVRQAKNGIRGVPVPALDAFEAISMLTKQILRNAPHMSMDDIWKMMDVFYPKSSAITSNEAQPVKTADVRMIANGASAPVQQELVTQDDGDGDFL